MRRFGSELEFISWVKWDGSGAAAIAPEYLSVLQRESFKLNRLSISKDTYIASGFNSFVVKLKNPPPKLNSEPTDEPSDATEAK